MLRTLEGKSSLSSSLGSRFSAVTVLLFARDPADSVGAAASCLCCLCSWKTWVTSSTCWATPRPNHDRQGVSPGSSCLLLSGCCVYCLADSRWCPCEQVFPLTLPEILQVASGIVFRNCFYKYDFSIFSGIIHLTGFLKCIPCLFHIPCLHCS